LRWRNRSTSHVALPKTTRWARTTSPADEFGQDGATTARLKQQLVAHVRATKGNIGEFARRMEQPAIDDSFFLDRCGSTRRRSDSCC